MKINNENFQIHSITSVRSTYSDLEYYALYNDLADCNNDNRCEQNIDMVFNSFCASATPTTHTLTVTDTQTVTSTSTLIETETVTSIPPTTVERYLTITVTDRRTIIITKMITITPTTCIQSCNSRVTDEGYDTTITTTVYSSYNIIQYDPGKTEARLTLHTQGGVSKPIMKYETSITQQAPIVALGSLTGLSIVVLASVIIGWAWTCWTIYIKKRREMGHMITSKNT